MKRRAPTQPRRGDGNWLAYSIAGLLMITMAPEVMEMAQSIYRAELEPHYWDAEWLVYPIAALCFVIGFYGLSFLLTAGLRIAVALYFQR